MKRFNIVKPAAFPLLLIPFAALIACWKLMASGPSCGHDFDFHLLSWMEAARHWQTHDGRMGVPYPHWVTSANYGAGEPRFVFYPPLSWMLGALLGLIAGWNFAPLFYTALALLGCGCSMYLLARNWLPTNVSAGAAAVYMLSPYASFVAYQRTAYGELLAAAFVPLVLLYALRKGPSVVPLALSFAAVWLSNAPAGVMAGYMLAFVTVIVTIVESQWQTGMRTARRTASGAALGLGLAAFYLVPAAFERRWVQIERAIGPGMRAEDSFLFGHTGDAFHDQVLGTVSWIAAFMLIVSFACAAVLLLRRRDSSFANAKSLWISVIALLPLILFLLLPISRFVWAQAPELAFLQFPWRWLLVEGVAFAVLAAAVLRGKVALYAGALCLILLIVVQQRWFYQPCDDEDAVAAQINDFQSAAGVEGTDEYVSRNVDNGAIQQGLPRVRVVATPDADSVDSSVAMNPQWNQDAAHDAVSDRGIIIEQWTGEHRLVRIETKRAGFAVLRLMDYPAWEVRINGVDTRTRPLRDDGLLTVPIAAGSSCIEVSYRATEDVWMGRTLSLLALAVLLLIRYKTGRVWSGHYQRSGPFLGEKTRPQP